MKLIFVLFVMLMNYFFGKFLRANKIKVVLQIPWGLNGILDMQSLGGVLMEFSRLELMAHMLMELISMKIIHW